MVLELMATFFACQKDIPVPNNPPVQIQDELIMVDSNSFVVRCKVDYVCDVDEVAFVMPIGVSPDPYETIVLVPDGDGYSGLVYFPSHFSGVSYFYKVKVLESTYCSEHRYFRIPQ